jgi:hypothetical protein
MDEQTNLEQCHVRLQEDFKTLKEARQGRCDLEKPLSALKHSLQHFVDALAAVKRMNTQMRPYREGHSHD